MIDPRLAIHEMRRPFHAALGVGSVVAAVALASSVSWMSHVTSPTLRIGLLVAAGATTAVILAVLVESLSRALARESAVCALEGSIGRARGRARDGSTHGTLSALAKSLWSPEVPLDARVARVQADALGLIWAKMAKTVAVSTLEAACGCGALARVPAQHGGRAVRCQACGAKVRVLVAPLAVREALDLLFARFGFGARPDMAKVEPTDELSNAIEAVREWLIEASKRSKKSSIGSATTPTPSGATRVPARPSSGRSSKRATSKPVPAIERGEALPEIEIPGDLLLPELDGPSLEPQGDALEIPDLEVPESTEGPALRPLPEVDELEPDFLREEAAAHKHAALELVTSSSFEVGGLD